MLTLVLAATILIDGILGKDEWSGARHIALDAGGEAWVLQKGDELWVAMKGAKNGFPTLCVGNSKRVELLHASAALGTAIYERESDTWKRRQDFTWSVRDSPRTTAAQKDDFLQSAGWLGNASNQSAPIREFVVRLNPDRTRIAIAFLHTDEPMTAAVAPKTLEDDCRSVRLLQGFTPETAHFAPETWLEVK